MLIAAEKRKAITRIVYCYTSCTRQSIVEPKGLGCTSVARIFLVLSDDLILKNQQVQKFQVLQNLWSSLLK
jgi:hypothetical protein